MSQSSVSNLVILSIENELVKNIGFDEVIIIVNMYSICYSNRVFVL